MRVFFALLALGLASAQDGWERWYDRDWGPASERCPIDKHPDYRVGMDGHCYRVSRNVPNVRES